ncbi:hypothetical protein PBY51_023275 [Eleginops maclovinus]|uniref:Uncharacterized protein n=1 Tax=Eleginops maclovinus TaxID=56733 RepID=A0AAN7WYG6_ELEMC|nr:hypothetical protein PBY51_023275 [Eleginops maclovinus]
MQTRPLAISLITEGPFIGITGALRRTINVAPPSPPMRSARASREHDGGVASRDRGATTLGCRLTREVQQEQLESADEPLQACDLPDCNYHHVMLYVGCEDAVCNAHLAQHDSQRS